MLEQVIRIDDLRRGSALPAFSPWMKPSAAGVLDRLGRPLRDLRISVTDRCNFRCTYCMPKEVFDKTHRFLPHSSLLSFEEITRVATAFVANGVTKIRLTGGEPLLRKNIEVLVGMLSALRTPAGEPLDLTLTTNGSLLKRKAQALADAGLRRVTVSLDGLDDAVFRRMNDVDFPVADVLDGIAAALDAGLGPVKVNMVVKRGTNDGQILPMARHFKGSPVVLRFIEYMDVGATNGWRMDEVMPSSDVVARIHDTFPLDGAAPNSIGETAARWRYADGSGEVGVVSSVSQAFCHDCNRARLSTEGRLFTCLFATRGHDLRELLRGEHDDTHLAAAIAGLWQQRSDRYSELRASQPATAVMADAAPRVEMHYIGG
jgi:cyclic pyranopterin phosphate synthase